MFKNLCGSRPAMLPNPTPLTFTARGTGTQLIRTTQLQNTTLQFNTGHGFDRPHTGPGGRITDLRTTSLTPDTIETAIAHDVAAYRASGGTLPRVGTQGFRGPLERTLQVEGISITYRVVETGVNHINIGTYFQQ